MTREEAPDSRRACAAPGQVDAGGALFARTEALRRARRLMCNFA
jgi:hypothetical protein